MVQDTRFLTLEELRRRVGMVMPIWFPPEMPVEQMTAILRGSLADVEAFLGTGHAVAVIDGAPHVEPALERIWQDQRRGGPSPFEIEKSPENEGKGGALARGLALLLDQAHLDAFAIRDDDGDHFIQDLPAFHALLRHIEQETQSDLVLVNGRRSDLNWPLGFVRGQYELLLDDIVWSALEYAAARDGWTVPRHYFGVFHRYPDLDSGYKMYTRPAAQVVVRATEALAAARPGMLRWGCEVLAVVEVVNRRGWLGEVERKSLAVQPLSTYGLGAHWQTVNVEMLSWTFERLGIPHAAAVSLFDNALLPLPLLQDADWRREMMELREAVSQATYGQAAVSTWKQPALL